MSNNEISRIKPIENPKSIFLKIAYWMTKRQYGKVISH